MIRNLSYVGVSSPAADEWRSFGTEVLGTQLVEDGADGAVRLRVDEAPWRLAVHPGEHDALAYLGWDLGDVDAVQVAAEQLSDSGVVVEPLHATARRPAHDVICFDDPFGFRHELASTPQAAAPFEPGREMGRFVTGNQGLGHVVLIVPDLDAAAAFYTGVMGFEVSDRIESSLSLLFLHCRGRAARHHSLALASVPGMVGLHHLMVEVADLDDVGRAYDLVRSRGIPLAMDLGRHTNDRMTSFYVRTPSGFEVEYGTGGVLIDDDTWQVGTFDAESTWGHRPPDSGMLLPGILEPFTPRGAAA